MRIFSATLAACLSACATALPADERQPADLAVAWNERILAIAETEDGFLTLKGVRTAAMMHIAMHDALASIHGHYAPYAYDKRARRADPVAAAAQAAFVVAVDEYPDQREVLAALRDRWLGDTDFRTAGINVGEAAAREVLSEREADGWNTEAEYRLHPMAPGVYAEFPDHSGTPQGFVFGAGWAAALPFALERHDQFRSPAPPALESAEYARAYNEVKRAGRFQSPVRTIDQAHLALWWKDFAENSHNRLVRDLVRKEQLGLEEATRVFALLNIAIFDAYVSVFDNKFFYNHWRPYTAIRWTGDDGNPDTEPEDTWTNLHRHTYAFPSYPSAHGTACAAAMTVIADTFGNDYPFRMSTPKVDIAGPFSGKIEMHPPTRDFRSFDEAAMECAMSRVYLGIHFRYDSVEGNNLGRRIGNYVRENHLVRKSR